MARIDNVSTNGMGIKHLDTTKDIVITPTKEISGPVLLNTAHTWTAKVSDWANYIGDYPVTIESNSIVVNSSEFTSLPAGSYHLEVWEEWIDSNNKKQRSIYPSPQRTIDFNIYQNITDLAEKEIKTIGFQDVVDQAVMNIGMNYVFKVNTIEPDQTATVVQAAADGKNYVTFNIPRGAQGPQGPKGGADTTKTDLQKILSCVTDVFQIDMRRSLSSASQYNYFNDSSFYLYNYTFVGESTAYYPYQSEKSTSATLSPIPVDRGSLGHGVQISFNLTASATGGTFVPVLNGYPVSDLGVSSKAISSGTNSYSFFTEFPADTDSSKNVGFGLKISGYTGTLKISNLEININDSFIATQSAYKGLESKINYVTSSMSNTDTANLFRSGVFDALSDYFVSRDTMNNLIETNLTSSILKTSSDITETNTLISKFAASSMVLSPSKVKGANVSAFGTMDYGKIQTEAQSLNLNTITVSLLVRANSTTDSSPFCNDDDWAKMEDNCAALMARGYKVLIQPYPYIDGGKYAETEWNPSDVDTFFTKYTAIIEKMATYAQSVGAYGIYVGTNLMLIEHNVDKMSALIQDAKSIFTSGLIFYRTNWWSTATWAQSTIDAYNTILNYTFWQYVDVIAIAAYFEVTDELNPSSETLQGELSSTKLYARKQDIVTQIKNFYTKWNKPIYFGELGIPPYSNAASKPYATQMDTTATYNESVQANWFDAWYTIFSQYDWWLGYSIFTIADSSSPYDPYGKQAASIIRMQTFGGEAAPKTFISVSGPDVPNTNDIWLVDDGSKNIIGIKKWNGAGWDEYSLKLQQAN